MAVGDLFNDGKLDAVINVEDGHPVLLRNVNPDHNHWLELKLVGSCKTHVPPCGPVDAIGTTVYVTANGMKQRGDVLSGGSYLSSNDPRPHFGLGAAARWRSSPFPASTASSPSPKAPASNRIALPFIGIPLAAIVIQSEAQRNRRICGCSSRPG